MILPKRPLLNFHMFLDNFRWENLFIPFKEEEEEEKKAKEALRRMKMFEERDADLASYVARWEAIWLSRPREKSDVHVSHISPE